MKEFNQIITVEVSVDSIAKQMLEVMSSEFKHSEMVVEATIATLIEKGGIGNLYNALNGFSPKINFQIGDKVVGNKTNLPQKVYAFWTPESIVDGTSVPGEIPVATVIEINEYADKKIKLAYEIPTRDGKTRIEERWDSHLKWDRIPMEQPKS